MTNALACHSCSSHSVVLKHKIPQPTPHHPLLVFHFELQAFDVFRAPAVAERLEIAQVPAVARRGASAAPSAIHTRRLLPMPAFHLFPARRRRMGSGGGGRADRRNASRSSGVKVDDAHVAVFVPNRDAIGPSEAERGDRRRARASYVANAIPHFSLLQVPYADATVEAAVGRLVR